MNTIELVQTVQDLTSEATYDRFSKAEILRWLNRGIEDIAVKTGYLTWKWRITTSANKREYPYPETAKSIYRMEYNGEPLPPCDFPTLDEALATWQASTGPPENWYHSWNRAFGIYPTPDKQYLIYALGLDRGAVLADDSDIPLIPDHFHRAPALFAAYQIKREDNDLTTMASLRNEYYNPMARTGIVQDMIDERLATTKKGKGRRVSYNRATVEEGQ